MDGDSAVDKAFDTIELLEAILLELPSRDLLLSRRVCRTWQAVVDSSLKIQQCLFCRPIDVLEPSYGDDDDPNADRDVIYQNAMAYDFKQPTCYKSSSGKAFTSTILENPLFRAIGPSHTDQWAARFHGDLFTQTLGIPRLADLQIWERPGASWKTMLVCQPAVRRVRIFGGGRFVDVKSKNGVTAGMVFRVIKRWRRKFGPFFRNVRLSGRHEWQEVESNAEVVDAGEAISRRTSTASRRVIR